MSVIHPAATVVLLRESDAGLQVLLTQRATGLSFMGGLWVFPGGRMEPSDHSPSLATRVVAEAVAANRMRMLGLDGNPIAHDQALGLHVAACRETFEEAGVLLARSGNVAAKDTSPLLVARLQGERAAASNPDAFAAMLTREGLMLEVERLVYWSHWITPSQEGKRFDTRFFALQVPPGQEASVDRSELTQLAWLTAVDVERKLQNREMKLAPPTLATLQDLWRSHARHGGLQAMLAAERNRSVPPILPKLAEFDGVMHAVMPWDPDYARLPGEVCVAQAYPEFLRSLPSRRAFRR